MAPRREDLGSWLEGTPGGRPPERVLGLPVSGRGSPAPLSRRVVGLLVDWAIASVISYAFFDYEALPQIAIFAASTAFLVSSLGYTIGHRVAGIQVVRLADLVRVPVGSSARGGAAAAVDGPWRAPGFVLGTTRTFLLCLVVPAVVWDSSGRGLHDVAAGTVAVRR